MRRLLRDAAFALGFVVALPAIAQDGANLFGLERGEHAVGFRLLEDDDRSRVVTGGAPGAAHARPVRTTFGIPPSRRAGRNRYWLKTVALGHADFTSYALVEGRGAATNYWEPATPARAAAHRGVATYVMQFFTAKLKAGSSAFLERDVRQTLDDSSATLEHRTAVVAPIRYDELVRKLVGGQGDEAIAELRALAAIAPSDALLTEFNLVRLCVSLLFTWNLAEQALPLLEFTLERYPSAPNARFALGEAQAALGNMPAAIDAFEQLLERFPGDEAIQSRIQALRNAELQR